MNSPVDLALQDVSAKEATYQADADNVASIQAAITAAQSPLPDAQKKLSDDGVAFNLSIDAAIVALQAAKITTP